MKTKGTKPLFVFDWDGVVFNTGIVKRVVGRSLEKLGCPSEVFLETAQKAKHIFPGYTPAGHGRLISTYAGCDSKQVERDIYRAINDHPGTFVFSDARRMLSILNRKGYPVDILSAGERDFQEYKIMRTRLGPLFRNVHIVDHSKDLTDLKANALRKLSGRHKEILFFDDKEDTIRKVGRGNETFRGKVLPILVWRRDNDPPRGLSSVRRLSWKEIRKIAIHNGFGPY